MNNLLFMSCRADSTSFTQEKNSGKEESFATWHGSNSLAILRHRDISNCDRERSTLQSVISLPFNYRSISRAIADIQPTYLLPWQSDNGKLLANNILFFFNTKRSMHFLLAQKWLCRHCSHSWDNRMCRWNPCQTTTSYVVWESVRQSQELPFH